MERIHQGYTGGYADSQLSESQEDEVVVSFIAAAELDNQYGNLIIGENPEDFDAIEVHGTRTWDDLNHPGETISEIDDELPTRFSTYVHLVDGGIECVGDHATFELAMKYATELSTKHGWPIHECTQQALAA